jgi:SAM-dependent methyltransferase
MGLDINSVQFLIAARRDGAEFGDVLTLGRQNLNVYPVRLRQVLAAHGFPGDAFPDSIPGTLYAEPLFRALGARTVSALDASSFEGAEFVHDLNQPIGPELRERFDLVFDGGTLEHVFQFPVALKSCMEMVRPGGRLFLHTVANNWGGHGFYQFSPELFYRALSPANGFEVESMILHRVGPYGRWYQVNDPERIRSRVEFITLAPVMLLVRARRTRVVPVFAAPPQQSDYTPRWDHAARGTPDAQLPSEVAPYTKITTPPLAARLPGVVRVLNVARHAVRLLRRQTIWNRRLFTPVPKP